MSGTVTVFSLVINAFIHTYDLPNQLLIKKTVASIIHTCMRTHAIRLYTMIIDYVYS